MMTKTFESRYLSVKKGQVTVKGRAAKVILAKWQRNKAHFKEQ
jgi:hypothetical protein